MKVILLETMSNLGTVGDVVEVSPGYARNFLIPMKKVVSASARNVKHVDHQKRIVEHKISRLRKVSEEVRLKLEKKGITITRKTGEQDKLFGSVTAMDIETALKLAGVVVNRKEIHMSEPIKKIGTYQIPVKLDGGVEAKISVEVVAEPK